jgi:hypothetical protein
MSVASAAAIGGAGPVFQFPPVTMPLDLIPPFDHGASHLIAKCALRAQEKQRRNNARSSRKHPNESLLSDIATLHQTTYENTKRKGALFCRSGTWLEVLDRPTAEYEARKHETPIEYVRGTSRENSRFTILEFLSVAFGLVSIRGVESNNYLCMNKHGKLYGTSARNYSSDCVFMEEMLENYYNLYSSCAYGTRRRPWYVALRRTGRPRRGRHTRKKQKSSHFLVIHFDDNGIISPVTSRSSSAKEKSSAEGGTWLDRLAWKWSTLITATDSPSHISVFEKKKPVALSDILSNSLNNRWPAKNMYEYFKRKNERILMKQSVEDRRQQQQEHSKRMRDGNSVAKAHHSHVSPSHNDPVGYRRRRRRERRLERENRKREQRMRQLETLRLQAAENRRRALRGGHSSSRVVPNGG